MFLIFNIIFFEIYLYKTHREMRKYREEKFNSINVVRHLFTLIKKTF